MPDRPKRKPKGNYSVGYCLPPKSGQFQRGQSGNPKGGKKREGTIRGALRAELDATQRVRENGKEKVLTKAEVLAKQWVRLAMEGKINALLQIAKIEPQIIAQVMAAAAAAPDPSASTGDQLTETDLAMMRWLIEGADGSELDDGSEIEDAGDEDGDHVDE
jgi:hypothetical protein